MVCPIHGLPAGRSAQVSELADSIRQFGGIIKKTIKDVSAGVELLAAAQTAFDQVSFEITNGGSAVTQIAASSREQARGVELIGQSISRVGEVTQNNVANATRTAQAATSMREQVQTTRTHLQELLDVVGASRLRTA